MLEVPGGSLTWHGVRTRMRSDIATARVVTTVAEADEQQLGSAIMSRRMRGILDLLRTGVGGVVGQVVDRAAQPSHKQRYTD